MIEENHKLNAKRSQIASKEDENAYRNISQISYSGIVAKRREEKKEMTK